MTQQMSRSGQLQLYEEELHHLEQELAGIKMVPGRFMTWGIEQCRESCPTSVHLQVRAYELRLYLNSRAIFRRQEESPDRNVWKRL